MLFRGGRIQGVMGSVRFRIRGMFSRVGFEVGKGWGWGRGGWEWQWEWGGLGVGRLWQNHGISPEGGCLAPLLSRFACFSSCCHLLISPPRSLLIRPVGTDGAEWIYGSEETPNSSEGVCLGGVMLHSDRSSPGTPEQPGSTVGTGPLSAPWLASEFGAS